MLNRLGRGDRISLGGGVLLVISLFMNWYSVSVSGFSVSGSAFDALSVIDFLLLIIGAGVVALILAIAADRLDESYAPAALAGGVVAAVLILFRMIRKPHAGDVPEGLGIDYSLAFGIFVALIAAIAIIAGQVMKAREV